MNTFVHNYIPSVNEPDSLSHHTSKVLVCFRKIVGENKLNMMEENQYSFLKSLDLCDPTNESGIWRKTVRAIQRPPSHATQEGQESGHPYTRVLIQLYSLVPFCFNPIHQEVGINPIKKIINIKYYDFKQITNSF